MAESKAKPDPWHESLTRGYEMGDMRVRWFAVAVVCFVSFAAVVHALLWYLVKLDAGGDRQVDQRLSAVEGYGNRVPTGTPPLQPTSGHERTAQEDLRALRDGEDAVFRDLGWRTDASGGPPTPPDALVAQVAASMSGREEAPGPATAPATRPAGRKQ